MEKFQHAFKVCTGDDELKSHLRSRIGKDTLQEPPTLTYLRFSRTDQFRLLVLLPGSIDDEVQCRLYTYDMMAAPKYMALSYVWGDKTKTLPVLCDQQQAQVSINLYSALIRIREPDRPLTVWVDALCIDQATDDAALRERASQVRMMNRIFSGAEHVLVDLGGATRTESEEFVRGLEDFERVAWQETAYTTSSKSDFPVARYGPDAPFWNTWYAFLRRPWFSRVWVVQEFVLAREVTMLMGSAKINPVSLIRTLEKVVSHCSSLAANIIPNRFISNRLDSADQLTRNMTRYGKQADRAGEIFATMFDYHETYKHDGMKQLLPALLDLSRYMATTDIRDSVFALAGLTSNWDGFGIEIDYLASEAAVRANVARALISTNNTFYCLFSAAGLNISGMTWMPLLRSDRGLITDRAHDKKVIGANRSMFKAAGNTCCLATVTIDNLLAIQGFRVDTIKSLAPSWPLPYFEWNKIMPDIWDTSFKIGQWYSSVKKWALTTDSDSNEIKTTHDLWTAMAFGIVKEGTQFAPIYSRASISALENTFQTIDGLESILSQNNLGFNDRHKPTSCNMQDNFADCIRSRLCRTAQGRIVNAPFQTVNDNEIWILFGIPLPMVLRNLGNTYAFVGPAYVHGLMEGEALDSPEREDTTVYLA